jgi:hypothetical protein
MQSIRRAHNHVDDGTSICLPAAARDTLLLSLLHAHVRARFETQQPPTRTRNLSRVRSFTLEHAQEPGRFLPPQLQAHKMLRRTDKPSPRPLLQLFLAFGLWLISVRIDPHQAPRTLNRHNASVGRRSHARHFRSNLRLEAKQFFRPLSVFFRLSARLKIAVHPYVFGQNNIAQSVAPESATSQCNTILRSWAAGDCENENFSSAS